MPKTKPKPPEKTPTPAPVVQSHAWRETIESIVIAFVLAFLFRTFEAEAFVIPTGSMAPTLMGRHKDVDCPKCGYRYQVSSSEEENEEQRRQTSDVIAGQCPMCRYTMSMRPDLVPDSGKTDAKVQRSFNGDRILVNKYLYEFSDPKRWDVVVFKFPGDAKVNYIKRLVGLPGEALRIFQGDVFISKSGATKDSDFEIARKPPNKILAMRQLVHDTNYDPAELDSAGWPLRWQKSPDDANNGWKLDKKIAGKNVQQRYTIEPVETDSWLRYEHLLPTDDAWRKAAAGSNVNVPNRAPYRRLITDANPYDSRISVPGLAAQNDELVRRQKQADKLIGEEKVDVQQQIEQLREEIDRAIRYESERLKEREGLHWVGDLMMEADVDVESAGGELLLDLVEAGHHFRCRVDLSNGEARLSATNDPAFAPKGKTSLVGKGDHRVAFSNFDDQLLLWVDGKVVEFDSSTAYDVKRVFGDRKNIIPQTSASDLGDFAPAGIGARGAKLSISRLQVWRDLYYISEDYTRVGRFQQPITDFNHSVGRDTLANLPSDPRLWDLFKDRNTTDFKLNNEQLFVMGDNSAESSDARLWVNSERGSPGGPYLEKRLLIGKALAVYWPHSWNRVPGTPIPFPLFPNVVDMRLVR